jgi:hypothetical protein
MFRRLHVAAVVCLCLMGSGIATAASKSGQGRASSRNSARASAAKGRKSSPRPAHVKASTKKDGTRAKAHDRKAEPKASTPHTAHVRVVSPPIRLVTDPVTGRRTFTNKPVAPLPAKTLPSSAARHSAPAHATAPRTVTSKAMSRTVVTRQAAPTGLIAPPPAAVRDARGRIQRSGSARHAFARRTG